ncbi:MAG: hypothetical protein ONA90_07695 [candidate division KSB1 bacterium]|nr:hypothetical protein [candidate division KSB1 bacterium]
MPVLTVKKPLREKLGDEATDALVDLINQAQAEQTNGILKFVEEKFERRLSEEISKLEVRLSQKISLLETKISETRADLIKWMFIFWVGQVAVILGILFAFFKK